VKKIIRSDNSIIFDHYLELIQMDKLVLEHSKAFGDFYLKQRIKIK